MKLYKTTITPTSNFATHLKGDTIFGQMCWAIKFTFGEQRLKELLSDYTKEPFLIVSDGFASGYLPKPAMPSHLLDENIDEKKANRKKIWLTMTDLLNGKYSNAKTNEEVQNLTITEVVVKNSLNYKTFTTSDSGDFAPYSEIETALTKQDIYFAINDSFNLQDLEKTFAMVSKIGYGKNTTIGKGFFSFSNFEEITINQKSNTFICLSPVCFNDIECEAMYYEPFTRFGKHGANLANKNPFKKPLLLANSGTVVQFAFEQNLSYIGKAIQGHSFHAETVHQGYSIVIPMKDIKHASI